MADSVLARYSPWTAAGAALGALTALGLWLATSPGVADPSPVPGEREGAGSPSTAPPAPGSAPPAESGEERREAVIEAAAGGLDPLFGVIGHGRVLEIDGTPVSGAQAVFEDDQAFRLEAGTGPGGSWTLDDLRAGEYDVFVEQRGFLPLNEAITVPETRSWKHDFVLERASSFPVRFEDPAGEPLALESHQHPTRRLQVVATRTRPGVGERVEPRNEIGRFLTRRSGNTPADLGPRYQGILQLRSAPSLWASAVFRGVVLASQPVQGGEEELVFVVDPASLQELYGEVRVRIIDRATGTPIVEHVTLSLPSGGPGAQPRDEGGTLVFSDVLPGSVDLELGWGQGGWERLEREVDVPPGGCVDLGTIALGQSELFVVHVRDEAGRPLVLSLDAARPELAGSPGDLNLRVHIESGADGSATIGHLAPGPTLLRAGGRDGRARVARLVDTAREKEVELVVPPGVEVVFVRERGSAYGRTILLEDASGTFLYSGRHLPREVFLGDGSYRLRVLDGERELEQVPFVVGGQRLVIRYGGA